MNKVWLFYIKSFLITLGFCGGGLILETVAVEMNVEIKAFNRSSLLLVYFEQNGIVAQIASTQLLSCTQFFIYKNTDALCFSNKSQVWLLFYFFYYKNTIEYTKDQYGIKTTCKVNRIVCVVP